MNKLLVAAALASAIVRCGHSMQVSYGVCAHLSRTEYEVRERVLDLVKQTGLASVRMDCDWRRLETKPGSWDFSRFDAIVDEAEKRGISVLPILSSPPDGVKVWSDARWGDFVRRVAKRYRGRIPAVEIWNEQNARSFWHAEPNAADYCSALKIAYEAVKGVAPEMTVSTGGFAGVPLDFIEAVYRAGGGKYFDVMAVHPYDERRMPETALESRLKALRALMARYGDEDKEIWITELGWNTAPVAFKAPEIMGKGLGLAFPGRKEIKALYTDFYLSESADRSDRPFFDAIREILPSNVVLAACRPSQFVQNLETSKVDVVIMPPFDERYPSGSLEAIARFVESGGTLVDFGGAPLFRAANVAEDSLGDVVTNSWEASRRLKVGAASDGEGCFFDRSRLSEADAFIPLHTSAFSNGNVRVNAALYRFAGKGNVLVSGLRERGMDVPVSESAQAKYLTRAMLIARECGVSAIWWYNLRSRDFDWNKHFHGIIHSDFTEKPAYAALKAFAEKCPAGAMFKKSPAWRSGKDYRPEWTRPDGTEAGAVWSVAAPRKAWLEFSASNVAFHDFRGVPIPENQIERRGTRVCLRVTDEPVYFEGAHLVCDGLGADGSASGKIRGPELWYTWYGGNVSREGVRRDLEEIAKAGISGVQWMHCERADTQAWTNICPLQIHCMDENWADIVSFMGDECKRLGLKLVAQNCPGWSQSGGPWVPIEHAQRDIAAAVSFVKGGGRFELPPIPEKNADADSDWRDVALLAFPAPEGEAEGLLRPSRVEELEKGDVRIFHFDRPMTVRTVDFLQPQLYNRKYPYHAPWIDVHFEAKTADGWKTAFSGKLPKSSWRDFVYSMNVACDELTSSCWRLTMKHKYPFSMNPRPRLYAHARQTNWEMKSGRVLRSLMRMPLPKQSRKAWVDKDSILVFEKNSPRVLPKGGDWVVMRFGNVNSKRVNAPAPKSATGWECDKLDPAGIEAHFKGYVDYLNDGPLDKGRLYGILVDSWECYGQTWTKRMPDYFRKACGYDLTRHLPSLFGYVIDSPEDTEKFLHDWRGLVGDLITKNYFKRMAELAHEAGLHSVYETAFGDIISGDALEYWKYSDEPMCEFWSPHGSEIVGHVTSHAFKPVRPCSSAAHVYGKSRVTAEAFTEWGIFWKNDLKTLKGDADRHFARGVTHLCINNWQHEPTADRPAPGTRSGKNGSAFSYKQTWWHAMRHFTDYFRFCEDMLESGVPANDVLWYLGDAVDHLPDAYSEFPEGFAFDYLGRDGLFTEIEWRDGAFRNRHGVSWRVMWVPDVHMMRADTKARLESFAAAGAPVVYGDKDALAKALSALASPDVSTLPKLGDAPNEDFMWIARKDGETYRYFVCAGRNGWQGFVTFRASGSATLVDPVSRRRSAWRNGGEIRLSANQSVFVEFRPAPSFGRWRLTIPQGEGADSPVEMDTPQSWSSLPSLTREAQAFSGTAVYETTFNLPDDIGYELDLGSVETVAKVFVNGKHVSTLWCEPYRCSLAGVARKGRNSLRVEVTNNWRNRIIYDQTIPEEKRRTLMMPSPGYWPDPKAPFDPSGILGPVALRGL